MDSSSARAGENSTRRHGRCKPSCVPERDELNRGEGALSGGTDDAIPPGWDYNPASWPQRLPIIFLAVVGFAIAMYLSLYQWEFFDNVFEPFFGDDSRKILRESWVSKLLPFPDAFLGALAYLADALAGVIGGRKRWRTMPWIVVLFGILVGPLGVVSIMLVVFQPVLFDAWCTLCLASAVVSVLMIGPAMDELLASLQYLRRVKDAKRPVWRAFWGVETPDLRDGREARTSKLNTLALNPEP